MTSDRLLVLDKWRRRVCDVEARRSWRTVWEDQFWIDAWSGDYAEWRHVRPQGHRRAPASMLPFATAFYRATRTHSMVLFCPNISQVYCGETIELIIKQWALSCSLETLDKRGTYIFRDPSSGVLTGEGCWKVRPSCLSWHHSRPALYVAAEQASTECARLILVHRCVRKHRMISTDRWASCILCFRVHCF